MLTRKTLEDAAFWSLGVCLDCGTVQAHAVEPDTDGAVASECSECGGDAVLSAELVLRCADFVEEGE